LELEILELFDTAAQEWTGFNLRHPRITHIAIKIGKVVGRRTEAAKQPATAGSKKELK
jgi:hypothetical protein